MTKRYLPAALCTVLCLASQITASAQENVNPIDTLAQSLMKTQAKLDVLSRISLSGYIQAQYQMADSVSIPSYAGGNFNPNVDNRFMVRRGRLKVAYNGNLSQYVLQVDVSEKGLTLKDAYAKFTDPWLKAFTLTAGMQNRPFGYEIGYSSSLRESPERGRMSQIIFPNERDLGAMITFQMPKGRPLDFLKIEGGFFNGTGAPSAGANTSDFDKKKDFIGRVRIDRTTKNEKIMYGLGASYYSGGWRQGTSNVWRLEKDSLGSLDFLKTHDTLNYGAINDRHYFGVDGQLTIDWAGGLTTIRGEYISGTQPAAAGSSASATTSPSAQPITDTYIRHFSGAYFYFIQNIRHSKLDVMVKYDFYDPNTDVSGNDIGKVTHPFSGKTYAATNGADLAYTTIGLGLIFKVDANVKFTAYYDMVKNETTSAKNSAGTAFTTAPYQNDLKDNVFTLRMQYKF